MLAAAAMAATTMLPRAASLAVERGAAERGHERPMTFPSMGVAKLFVSCKCSGFGMAQSLCSIKHDVTRRYELAF